MQPRTPGGYVLVVEDPFICRFVGGILKRAGRLAFEAEHEQAVRMLRDADWVVSLLITNQPARFLEFADTVPLIYIAAFPDPALANRFRHCRMLCKPFLPAELIECAAELAPPEKPS
jgi:hypothetical protein